LYKNFDISMSSDCFLGWSEEEDTKDYRRGGYHPVVLGEKCSGGRYCFLGKLGWGHFSTVWFAWDEHGRQPVVLKVQKSAARYTEAAKDEIKLLRAVRESVPCAGRDHLVLLQDHFIHRGVHGLHHVMAFEVLGPTLLSLVKQTGYAGLPIAVVRRLARCVLLALSHLHEQLSIIHTDLKPENVLCALRPGQLEAMLKHVHAVKPPLSAAAAAGYDFDSGRQGKSGTDGLSKNQKRRLKLKERKQALPLPRSRSPGHDEGATKKKVVAQASSGKARSTRAAWDDPPAAEPRVRQLRLPHAAQPTATELAQLAQHDCLPSSLSLQFKVRLSPRPCLLCRLQRPVEHRSSIWATLAGAIAISLRRSRHANIVAPR
jgi:serine/threonine-protein kinase SRPK3